MQLLAQSQAKLAQLAAYTSRSLRASADKLKQKQLKQKQLEQKQLEQKQEALRPIELG